MDEYYCIIHGWCVYYYCTYIFGVGVGLFICVCVCVLFNMSCTIVVWRTHHPHNDTFLTLHKNLYRYRLFHSTRKYTVLLI